MAKATPWVISSERLINTTLSAPRGVCSMASDEDFQE